MSAQMTSLASSGAASTAAAAAVVGYLPVHADQLDTLDSRVKERLVPSARVRLRLTSEELKQRRKAYRKRPDVVAKRKKRAMEPEAVAKRRERALQRRELLKALQSQLKEQEELKHRQQTQSTVSL